VLSNEINRTAKGSVQHFFEARVRLDAMHFPGTRQGVEHATAFSGLP
jgi:hypothetical protein